MSTDIFIILVDGIEIAVKKQFRNMCKIPNWAVRKADEYGKPCHWCYITKKVYDSETREVI